MTGGRAALFETLMRTCLAIAHQELLDRRLQVASTEDQQVVEQLPAGGRTNLSAIEFARGDLYGKSYHLHALALEDLIESSAEL